MFNLSALEVNFNVMRSINPRFAYLLTHLLLLTLMGELKQSLFNKFTT